MAFERVFLSEAGNGFELRASIADSSLICLDITNADEPAETAWITLTADDARVLIEDLDGLIKSIERVK